MELENDDVPIMRDLVVYGFTCAQGASKLDPWTRSTYRRLLPDLLIRVNFTELHLGAPMSNPTSHHCRTSKFDRYPEENYTLSAHPGCKCYCLYIGDIRQVFLRPSWAALGIFQVCITHFAEILESSQSCRQLHSFVSLESLLHILIHVPSSIRMSVHCASFGKMIGQRRAFFGIIVRVLSLMDSRVLAVCGQH